MLRTVWSTVALAQAVQGVSSSLARYVCKGSRHNEQKRGYITPILAHRGGQASKVTCFVGWCVESATPSGCVIAEWNVLAWETTRVESALVPTGWSGGQIVCVVGEVTRLWDVEV